MFIHDVMIDLKKDDKYMEQANVNMFHVEQI